MNLHNAYVISFIILSVAPVFSGESPKENPKKTLLEFNLEMGYAHLKKEVVPKQQIISPQPHKATALFFYINRVPTTNSYNNKK